jgi:hypothetical protein
VLIRVFREIDSIKYSAGIVQVDKLFSTSDFSRHRKEVQSFTVLSQN